MKRRLLASLLTLVMMLNLLPTVAWARNDEGIDADSVEMYSSDDVVTSGPITIWTGKIVQITVPEESKVGSSNTDIVSVEKNATAVTLTGGSKEGRAEVTTGESTWVVYNYASEAEYNYLYSLFHGKTISVMGDSISTIKDKIPSGNALYYDNTTSAKTMTFERNYWGDIITRFGAVEGIDEAWSGSTIGSKAASMASKDRINKLDDNGTPDVILYYGGRNPDSSVGTFDPDADYAKTVDWAKSYSDTASAYAASLQRMKETYPGAEIIAIIPYYEQNNISKQAEVIEQIAKHYDITTIDLRELRNQEGISPKNELHPNMDGHSQIAAYICQQLYEQRAVTPDEKTVTYDANGGSFKNGSDPIKQSVTAELPKATRAGYAFVGWFDQAAGGNKIASALDTAIPSGMQDNLNGTTLYAHWTHTFTWNFNSDMNAVDADGNVIISVDCKHGDAEINGGTVTFDYYQGKLSTPFTLDPTQNWCVEWREKNQAKENMLFSSTATREKGMTYIFLYEPSIYMGTYDVTNNKIDYINFGGPAYQKEPTSNEYSVVKLENNYDKATETSLVTLSVDGEQVFAKLNTQGRYGSHGSSLTASDYEQYALEKLNFTFNYLGGNRDGGDTPAWKLSNTFDYIKVTLGDDHTHTYGTTYSSDSTGHWKTCTECGANGEFSKHTGGTATCTAKAVCETCDQPYGELGAHKLTKTDAKAATCTEAGNEAYWTCSGCGKYFSDENGINEIEKDSWVLKTLGHDMTKTDAKEATCTEDGNNEYYTCSRCGGVFKDEAGTQATTVEAETLKKLGHDWSNKNGICAVCHTKCDRVHKPGTTCSVCHKYTSYPYVPGAPTYPASAPAVPNGTVTVSPANASKGANVTVTVKPNEGYVLETLTVTDKNGDELKLTDKGNGKYTFTMPGSKVEVKATFMEDNSVFNFFYDVPNDAFFYEAVKWAVKSGVTNGLSDTMFGPYESCTRMQIVTFLWRAAGSPEPKTASSFTDVPASAYYAKAVAWAIENGITNGMTETTFAPNATCTRGQSVTFLYRALKGTASGSANFTDVKSDTFYADAINWAVANNVTNGTSNTTFSPNADCTRAEIVTFLYRAYQGK